MQSDDQNVRDVAQRWTTAIAKSDLGTLRELMAEDIVVIHGNGRLVEGRDAVAQDLAQGLAGRSITQKVHSKETILSGSWAFDRADVETSLTPREGGDSQMFLSRTMTVLHKEGASWKVARTIGVVVQDETAKAAV